MIPAIRMIRTAWRCTDDQENKKHFGAKLKIKKDAVVYDVELGTGSISVGRHHSCIHKGSVIQSNRKWGAGTDQA